MLALNIRSFLLKGVIINCTWVIVGWYLMVMGSGREIIAYTLLITTNYYCVLQTSPLVELKRGE